MNGLTTNVALFGDISIHHNEGVWIGMAVFIFVLVAVGIVAISWLAYRFSQGRPLSNPAELKALDILDRRFAHGDLSVEEYERRRAILLKHHQQGE